MPWNDNANPGPWGSPPSGDGDKPDRGRDPGPWRPQGGGGGPRGPDFGRFGRHLRDAMGGPGGRGVRPGVVAALVGGAFFLWAASGVYFVQPNEEAVITTFGAFSGRAGPGARYHLPAPIQAVEKVPVTNLQRIDVGLVGDTDKPEQSLMLTRDENIVDMDFAVTWRVSDPAKFVFTVKDPEESVTAVAESAMREVVGKTDLQPIISTGRGQVQLQTAAIMQRTLDAWGAGIDVVEVQIRSAQPPRQVVAAFQDVQNAEQDKAAAVNEARAYQNRVVAEARGDAVKVTKAAEAYREQAIRLALGDASRFNAILAEYKRAPGATRDRLYLETMERVLANSNKVIVDGKGTTAPIILPPDVFRSRQPQPQVQQPARRAPPKTDDSQDGASR